MANGEDESAGERERAESAAGCKVSASHFGPDDVPVASQGISHDELMRRVAHNEEVDRREIQKVAEGLAPDLVLAVDLAVGMASPQLMLRPGLLPLPRIEYVRSCHFTDLWCEVVLKSGKMATVNMPMAVLRQKLQAYYVFQYAPHAVQDGA